MAKKPSKSQVQGKGAPIKKAAKKSEAKSSSKSLGKAPMKSSGKSTSKSASQSTGKSASKPSKSPEKSTGKSAAKVAVKTTAKSGASAGVKPSAPLKKSTEVKAKAKSAVKDAEAGKAAGSSKLMTKGGIKPSVMGGKPKKDADDLDDSFLDDDIEIDPELAEFVEDVAELEEVDAAAEKAIARGGAAEEEEEEAAPIVKKTPKEKSASERRIKKERDLLSGIDRNGDLSEIWQKFFDTHKNEKPKQYNMRDTFEAKSALQHVKLGWGFILSNINDRLEVLFKEGIKILISNYKS